MTIEQQDFLQEYLKDKPDFRYESSFYIFTAENNNYVILVYDYEDNFYCKITFHNKNPVAQFLLPQTYEKFKTIMDIFLGVENANP